MVTKIQKWGNSQGLRVPKELLAEADLTVGDEVSLSARGGQIVIEPVSKVRRRYDLKELLANIPKDHQSQELDWGAPRGKEGW